MGAWRYCPKCDASMDAPTIREALGGEQLCPRCSYVHVVEGYEQQQAFNDFVERVERIEKVLTATHLGGYPNEPA